jgi:hypothetical protein
MGHVQPKKKQKAEKPDPLIIWRYDELRALGLSPDEAMPLLMTADIVHSARTLAERGCPPHLIAHLLEE